MRGFFSSTTVPWISTKHRVEGDCISIVEGTVETRALLDRCRPKAEGSLALPSEVVQVVSEWTPVQQEEFRKIGNP